MTQEVFELLNVDKNKKFTTNYENYQLLKHIKMIKKQGRNLISRPKMYIIPSFMIFLHPGVIKTPSCRYFFVSFKASINFSATKSAE